MNSEALYYWRPTYWNGDQHKLPRPEAAQTDSDRFLAHLRQVPELAAAIAESDRRWGVAHPFDVCAAASRLVADAYRVGDEETALRIVTALLPALDEGSPTYAPNCVAIAFLENEAWHESWMQEYVHRWPVPIRDDLREQLQAGEDHTAAQEQAHAQWDDLFRSGRGQPVDVLVGRLRSLSPHPFDDPGSVLGRELLARFLSDHRWLYRHPVDSVRLAWRHRAVHNPLRTLAQIRSPGLAG